MAFLKKIKMHIFYSPNSFIATVRLMNSATSRSICTNSLKSTRVGSHGFLSMTWQPTIRIIIIGLEPPADSVNGAKWLQIRAILTLKRK